MANHNLGQISKASGLRDEDAVILADLVKDYGRYRSRNAELTKYYEGKVKFSEVDFGAPMSDCERIGVLDEISCAWPAKVVDALKNRSLFDAFWSEQGEVKEELDIICEENDVAVEYSKAVTSELVHGCCFATLTMTENDRSAVKFHTAQSAAVMWDNEHNHVLAGFAIIDSAKLNGDRSYKPSLVNMYTSTAIIVLRRVNTTRWEAEYHEHKMGRPLMVAFRYKPTFDKPLGRSRISRTVMGLTDEYLRTMGLMSICSVSYTYPQRYALGVDETVAKELEENLAKYHARMIALSLPNENGVDKPDFGQLPAASMTPFTEVLRTLAADLSGATDVPISELGVIHDNPSSAEAIYAAKEALVIEAEMLNKSNGIALREIVLMAYAMNEDISYDEIPLVVRKAIPHFKSAAMPSVVSQADAMVKIAAVDEGFAGTRAFYSQVGFSDALIGQIESERIGRQSANLLQAAFDRINNGADKQAGA